MKKYFLAIAVCFWFAKPVLAGGWTEYGQVDVIYVHSSFDGVLVKRGDVINPSNCVTTDWMFLSKTNKNFDQLYAYLLAAEASKKIVRIYVDGCENERPYVQHMMNQE